MICKRVRVGRGPPLLVHHSWTAGCMICRQAHVGRGALVLHSESLLDYEQRTSKSRAEGGGGPDKEGVLGYAGGAASVVVLRPCVTPSAWSKGYAKLSSQTRPFQ